MIAGTLALFGVLLLGISIGIGLGAPRTPPQLRAAFLSCTACAGILLALAAVLTGEPT